MDKIIAVRLFDMIDYQIHYAFGVDILYNKIRINQNSYYYKLVHVIYPDLFYKIVSEHPYK
jgi:hypothetical protein